MEHELELVAVARYQLKSFLYLHYARDISKFMKLVLVVAWCTFSCYLAD